MLQNGILVDRSVQNLKVIHFWYYLCRIAKELVEVSILTLVSESLLLRIDLDKFRFLASAQFE